MRILRLRPEAHLHLTCQDHASSPPRARALRSNQTDDEKKLWWRLRNRQIADAKFVRQEPIGPYIVDFICREQGLIIE